MRGRKPAHKPLGADVFALPTAAVRPRIPFSARIEDMRLKSKSLRGLQQFPKFGSRCGSARVDQNADDFS